MAIKETGTCKHGTFPLLDGCSKCLAERRKAGIKPEDDEMEDGLQAEGLTLANTETAVALRPGEDVEVIAFYEQSLKIKEYAKKRVIAKVEDLELATEDLTIIGTVMNELQSKRKDYVKPHQDLVKEFNEAFKILMEPIVTADTITRDKMLAFNREQEKLRQEQEAINQAKQELAEREAALNGQEVEPVDLVEVSREVPTTIKTGIGNAGMTDHWVYEVFDFALLSDDYKLEDTVTLNSIAKKNHDKKPIPGVRFFNKPYIARRAK